MNHLFTEPNCKHKKSWNTCSVCHLPAELNLASQDWEERFLMATIYQEDSGFQKFGEGEPTKWKTDWDKVKQFIEKEISLARNEAVAEYQAELSSQIKDGNLITHFSE
jgi:hypothetical protein